MDLHPPTTPCMRARTDTGDRVHNRVTDSRRRRRRTAEQRALRGSSHNPVAVMHGVVFCVVRHVMRGMTMMGTRLRGRHATKQREQYEQDSQRTSLQSADMTIRHNSIMPMMMSKASEFMMNHHRLLRMKTMPAGILTVEETRAGAYAQRRSCNIGDTVRER
jgi:hypothetical protein